MSLWLLNYILSLLIALILAGIIIPNVLAIAFRRNLFDEVNERKIHRGVVPRLGGISFLPSLMFSFCVVVGCNIRLNLCGVTILLQNSLVPVFFLLCALMLMYLVGIADDLIGVRYRAKFVSQIISGMLIVTSGSWIMDLYGFCGIGHWPTIFGWLSTVFLVIYVINAINLIDGIDGLASGLSAIALVFYSSLFLDSGEYLYALIAGATLGTLVPFFYFNVFGSTERHRKIFMGDTGSLTIGVVLAFLSIKVFNISGDSMKFGGNLLVLAVTPIIVPCFDVVRVFFHRVRRRSNPFLPDKCHIHHKLLALGYSQRAALVTILVIDVTFIMLNLFASLRFNPTWIIAADMLLWILFNVMLTRQIRYRERKIGKILYE